MLREGRLERVVGGDGGGVIGGEERVIGLEEGGDFGGGAGVGGEEGALVCVVWGGLGWGRECDVLEEIASM